MEENKKTVKIEDETWVVYNPNEVVNELSEVESNEEPKEEKESNVPNMLLLGAVFAASAAATHIGIKIYDKVKTKRINKELARIKEELKEQFTKNGSIDDYTEDTLDEIAKYMYFKKHNNL